MSFFIPAFILIAIIGAIYSAIAARKRREGLFELAQRLNLNFDAGKDEEIPERFGFLKQFDEGHDRYAANVISGNYQQNEILAFDYHYTTGSGKNRQDHNLSFVILVVRGSQFPQLTIHREGFFDRVAETFGLQDIKFESAEFSKAFCVRSPDKKFAYDVCNARMMEYLLANRDLSVEIENEVIALAFNSRISADQFELNLQRLIEIRSRLPDYLFTNT
ncbi:MAG TPA: DUF3137 domain-containing protein [Verrucomicrobiae bacterium]